MAEALPADKASAFGQGEGCRLGVRRKYRYRPLAGVNVAAHNPWCAAFCITVIMELNAVPVICLKHMKP
ncbi:MAG: hypothetical protein ACFWUL_05570 [Dialister sp.]|jgi:hypothetical protein